MWSTWYEHSAQQATRNFLDSFSNPPKPLQSLPIFHSEETEASLGRTVRDTEQTQGQVCLTESALLTVLDGLNDGLQYRKS